MNKQIKKDWVKALRSGKYRQAQEQLRVGGKFCCLGVLCDLHRKKVGGKKWDLSTCIPEYSGNDILLPGNVMEWAGLEQDDPTIGDQDLSEWNDAGESFEKIANLIENNL